MNIYLSHSRSFDFRHLLYEPLLESELAQSHRLILPHQNSDAPFPYEKNLPKIDLIVAEVSYPSTGQGIEIGLAHALKKQLVCFYKNGANPSTSLSATTHDIFSYLKPDDLIRQLTEFVKRNKSD